MTPQAHPSPAVVVRAAREEDLPALCALDQRAVHALVGRPSRFTPEVLWGEFTAPGRNRETDNPVALVDDVPVGFGFVHTREPMRELALAGTLDPEAGQAVRRAAWGALLDAFDRVTLARTADLPTAERQQAAFAHSREADKHDVLAARGYRHERDVYGMEIDLRTGPRPAVEWPEGITVLPEPGPDELAEVCAVVSEAFRDHPGDMAFTEQEVEHWVSEPDFRRDTSVLVRDAQGAVGVVLGFAQPDGGYVGDVAVLRRGRGRGLATAMLLYSLGRFALAGDTVVRLHVEAAGTTGALGVYERAGMHRAETTEVWIRPLDQVPTRSAGSDG